MALLKDNLILHCKMNDDAATATVVDATGNHDGTYKDAGGNLNTDTGASTGKILGALDFDGIDEYVEIADHADFDFTSAISCFLWAKFDTQDTDIGIIAKYIAAGNKREWLLATRGLVGVESQLAVSFGDSTDGTFESRQTTVNKVVTNDIWYHLGFTYNGIAAKIYVNGVEVSTTTDIGAIPATLYNGNANLEIGSYGGGSYNFDGLIDDAMIFDKTVTPLEVKYLYNNGAGRTTIPFGIQLVRTGQAFSSRQEM